MLGFPCPRTASTQCFDCGSELCESHTETCGICHGIFCPSCLSFHSVQSTPKLHQQTTASSGTKKSLNLTLCSFEKHYSGVLRYLAAERMPQAGD